MRQADCPYLIGKKTAFRASLDLSAAAPVSVIVSWYCRHPFHGMPVEFGNSRSEADEHCAVCPLPRQEPDGAAG